jgi:hypothetical protein
LPDQYAIIGSRPERWSNLPCPERHGVSLRLRNLNPAASKVGRDVDPPVPPAFPEFSVSGTDAARMLRAGDTIGTAEVLACPTCGQDYVIPDRYRW